ncbi:MAG: lipoprotein signal peptidase [Panacagrimonas sp.]|nr:signal peptidase II [Panacagrimonas sp.]MCC2654991.1 lipoprotein signal peptidase [Panacagrimonas sp.]
MTFRLSNVHWLWLSAGVMLADQITKQMVIRSIERFESIPVTPLLNWVHMHNTGAAFSMLSQMPPWFFVLLAVGVSVGILIWMRRNPLGQRLVASGLALILGGALGNVIDRVRLGHVTDFVDFHIDDWHFAAFNVADAAITVGAGLLILDMLLDTWRARAARKPAGEGPLP